MRKCLVIASMIACLVTASCATKESPQPAAPEPTAPQGVQIANPASVNCEQKGGKLEIVEEAAGQKGICVLPDGTRCEEWAYFRGECP